MPDSMALRGAGMRRTAAAAMLATMLVGTLVTPGPAAGTTSMHVDASTRVIVSGVADAGAQVATAVRDAGGQVLQRLSVINGVVAEVPSTRLDDVRRGAGVRGVVPDGTVTVSSTYDGFVPQDWAGSLPAVADVVGADAFWSQGHHGGGVDVALIDTGVSEVPGLDAGQVLHGPDLSFDSQDPAAIHVDTYGHGTHLAGIIAGREVGAALPSGPDDTNFVGMAPGARLLSVKIGDRNGTVDVSQALAAIDWVVQHRDQDGLDIRVLNLSFGFDSTQGYQVDPLAYAAEMAWRNGIVVVAAAGNGGHRASLSSPAYSPHVLAVGATDSMGTRDTTDDAIPTWSSCDPLRNPDVVAPGRTIVSARVPVSYVAANHPESEVTPTLARGSGTSQSAAVVSGAAALLISQRPDITPDQVKALLTSTADPIRKAAPPRCQGAGVIDLAEVRDAATPDTSVTAPFSSGLGSLEAARGPAHVRDSSLRTDDPDAVLHGEQDIFGQPWSGSQWTGSQWTGSQWTGGTWTDGWWNGSQWTGSQGTGSQWTGSQWTGSQWTGSQWTGSQWTGSQWTSVVLSTDQDGSGDDD